MIKRKLLTVILLISSVSMLAGCSKDGLWGKKTETDIPSNYKVNADSKIEDDLQLLGMNDTDVVENLALTDIKAIFPGDTHTLIYFIMPEDTEDETYRVENITINNKTYDMILKSNDGYYQKYIIDNFKQEDTGEYEVSKINFIEKNTEDTFQYNLSQGITAKIEENRYIFEQEYYYSVVLSGQTFESVYQFNKETNVFMDLWAKVIPCVETIDEDKRSFYYFAFNCYDPQKNIYFNPDDILRLDVEYTLLTYQYEGKEKDKAENIIPKEKDAEQTIKPEEVTAMAENEKKSNKKLYKYDTINKLSDADINRNIEDANSGILSQAAREYDWAVAFGSEEGYPYKKNKSGWPLTEYDIAFSKIENLKTINIKYRVDGKTFKTRTSSLVKDKLSSHDEDITKPTKFDERQEAFQRIVDNKNRSFIWKAKEIIILYSKPFIPVICIVVVLLIVMRIIYVKAKKKYGNVLKKLKSLIGIEDKKDD